MNFPIMFIIAVMRNSSSPIAMSDESFNPSASPNWLAMILAIVFPVVLSVSGIWFVLPISIVTVIVSPNARPMARMYAEKIPEPAIGNITRRITSARVAPIAYAPSFKSDGTILMNSALSDAAYGTIMMASTKAAVRIPEPCGERLRCIKTWRSA